MRTAAAIKTQKSKEKSARAKLPSLVVLRLWVCAGGRCEFRGCNELLLRDSLTLQEANFSNIAHIVAASRDGPRGDDPLPMERRNDFDNLMLVCSKHHKLMDDRTLVEQYPVSLLRQFKNEHEYRIVWLTESQPQHKTTVVRLQANIRDDSVSIPFEDIRKAILPRYPSDPQGIEIDLTALRDRPEFLSLAAEQITDQLGRHLYTPGMAQPAASHVSVFALAPIPLLVHLGHKLSNKISADLYQRHRDTEDWTWKDNGTPVLYKVAKVRSGNDPRKVALVLCLSGTIAEASFPPGIGEETSIYQITLEGIAPNPTFLRTRDDLERFKAAYHEVIGTILQDHPDTSEIHLLPAVPAPIAIICGRELLPKAHPSLLVYDYDKKRGGFAPTLTINHHDK